jgi:hypothetical protein
MHTITDNMGEERRKSQADEHGRSRLRDKCTMQIPLCFHGSTTVTMY